MGVLGSDQTGDERVELIAAGKTFASDLIEACAHTIELEFVHGVENLMAFHQATLLMLS